MKFPYPLPHVTAFIWQITISQLLHYNLRITYNLLLVFTIHKCCFRSNPKTWIYVWNSACWKYEATSWCYWFSAGDGNFFFFVESNLHLLKLFHHIVCCCCLQFYTSYNPAIRDLIKTSISFKWKYLCWYRFSSMQSPWIRYLLLDLYSFLLSMLQQWRRSQLEQQLILFSLLAS